jgi:hypothetical protein
MQNANYYETSDLGLATALVCVGVTLVRINKANPRRALFIFTDSGQATRFEKAYWDGALTVPAQVYFEAIRRLKARLYS